MAIELDHFFILTEPGASQAGLLSDIGLIEGTANSHQGQGTANRRFCFADSMLELLYVRDSEEAMSGLGSRLRFVDRAADGIASPFGIIVRSDSESTNPPFPGWKYHPEYFDAESYFHIGENSDLLEEPLCICMPFNLPAPSGQPVSVDPYTSVTELRISIPSSRPSGVLKTLAQCKRISFCLGEPHLMEIVFNEEKEGKCADLRPELPLLVRW